MKPLYMNCDFFKVCGFMGMSTNPQSDTSSETQTQHNNSHAFGPFCLCNCLRKSKDEKVCWFKSDLCVICNYVPGIFHPMNYVARCVQKRAYFILLFYLIRTVTYRQFLLILSGSCVEICSVFLSYMRINRRTSMALLIDAFL